MWKYYIVLFTENCYGNLIEGKEHINNVLPVCNDYNVAKEFDTPDELNAWIKENTSLNLDKCEYGIHGIYYPNKV